MQECYLVGASWGDGADIQLLDRFLAEGIWENGDPSKLGNIDKTIPVGATIFIKSSYTAKNPNRAVANIKARGVVTANPQDGRYLSVNWDKTLVPYLMDNIRLPNIGGYRKKVNKVRHEEHLNWFLHGILPDSVTREVEEEEMPQLPLNQILYGPPGTGKTYETTELAVAILEGTSVEEIKAEYKDNRGNLREKFKTFQEAGRVAFVTFHQAFTYEDFVEGIKPVLADSNVSATNAVQYQIASGVFNKMCNAAQQARTVNQEETAPPYVLIIDEINRGNVANIFGELITLLEEDKRAEREEEAVVTLPYSKEPFTVPNNLYLIGTMNTADKSVEAPDAALRRRFSFTEMRPRSELLSSEVDGIDLRTMLTAINARLEKLLDHDHCISHAVLMNVTSLDGLREAFRRNIIPLLQEYFYSDWGKLGHVLGEAFIRVASDASYDLLPVNGVNAYQQSKKKVYRVTHPESWDGDAFQAIYS